MRLWNSLFVFVVLSATGCNAQYLRNRTLDQLATVTELRYQQVLDNLARTAADPGIMPSFAVIDKGSTQLQDQANPSGALTFDPFGLTSEMINLSASRQLAGEWDTGPITDPDKLHAMRCVYHRVLGIADPCDACDETLRFFKVAHDLEKMRSGWMGVGKKCDVPRGTCRVAHCGNTYVWVNSGGVDSLTWLTMAIMDIATVDKTSLAAAHPTQTVQVYEYFPNTNNIKQITTNTETKKTDQTPGVRQQKLREPRFNLPTSGLMFTPTVQSR